MSKTKSRRELLYTLSAVSLFLISGGLIKAPFGGNNIGNPLSFLISGALFIITAIALTKLFYYLFSLKKRNLTLKIVYGTFAAVLIAFAFYTFKEYVTFVYDIILPRTPKVFIAIVFAACVFFFIFTDRLPILKFSVISATAATLIFFAFFILSIKNFNNKNIFSSVDFNVTHSLKEIGKYYLTMFLPALIPIAFLSVKSKLSPISTAIGAGWGFLLCIICIADSVLSFGYALACRLDYPYIEDISTITVGSLFTRMDGFAYFAFFPAYLICCAITLKLAIFLLNIPWVKREEVKKTMLFVILSFFVFFS